ncbi:hypothetical protein NMG60_11008104 [Bertholletia excelsa]
MPRTEGRGKKRIYISISSSSSSGDNDEEEDLSEGEWGSESESEEYDGNDKDYDEEEEIGISTSSNDDVEDDYGENKWSDEEGELDDQENEESPDPGDDESLCNSVIRLLREKSDMQELNLRECKSYLRQNGLRITGTKAECIQRIMEHWRIKEGNVKVLYPRSSFVINCTGDVCKGDVVLFTQKVYKKFDKVTKRGSFLGSRTIAGRVVKESYGAEKQQHTFTIEVLWSKGIKTLPPLFPLLVKGRNLYKLKTYRQRWNNGKEREKVLAEKHKRGAAARLERARRKRRKANLENKGVKRLKHLHHARESQTRIKADSRKGKKQGYRRGKAPVDDAKSINCHQKNSEVSRACLKKISKAEAPKSSKEHQNLTFSNTSGGSAMLYPQPPQNFLQSRAHFHQHHHWRSAPFHFPSHGAGSTSPATRFIHSRPYMDSSVMTVSQSHYYNHVTCPPGAFSYPRGVLMPVSRSHGHNDVSYPPGAFSNP